MLPEHTRHSDDGSFTPITDGNLTGILDPNLPCCHVATILAGGTRKPPTAGVIAVAMGSIGIVMAVCRQPQLMVNGVRNTLADAETRLHAAASLPDRLREAASLAAAGFDLRRTVAEPSLGRRRFSVAPWRSQ